MRPLYEIDKEIAEFEWDIDTETGEILNPDALDELQMEREQKIEGVGLHVKNLMVELDGIKKEKDALTSREKSLTRQIDGYKEWLGYALDGQKFSTPRVAMSFRKSESVLVKDEFLIPDEYKVCSVVKKPDKKVIKDALKSGKEIMGVELIEKKNIQIK